MVLVSALGLAACSGGDSSGEGTATPTATEGSGGTGGMEMEGMEEGTETGEATGSGTAATASPATDLRVTLDRLLGEHAMFAMFGTQKGFAGKPDFKPLAATLDENSVDLADAIGSVYGDEAREEFLNGNLKWRDHIGFFVDYTGGLAKEDEAAQRKAAGNLKGYTESFSGFLATATELPKPAVRDSISMHVEQLTDQINSYAAGNYEDDYGHVREAYAHMFGTGDTLAGAIAKQSPQDFEQGNVTQSAADLRVTLDRLLGEHAILAMMATQKGYDGDEDFKAIAAALDENSVDLADAIGSVYGPEAREEFLNGKLKWRAHIGFFVDYTVALAKKDEAGQKKAVGNLKGYIESFSAFLAEATGLPNDAVRKSITQHVNQLKGQIDAYAQGDYERAYRLQREAYAHMFMTGDTLAGAIVEQSPDKFAS